MLITPDTGPSQLRTVRQTYRQHTGIYTPFLFPTIAQAPYFIRYVGAPIFTLDTQELLHINPELPLLQFATYRVMDDQAH